MPFRPTRWGRLHYRVDGDAAAPALILSNSLAVDLSMWEPQLPLWARDHRVVRYDQRGHGASSAPPGDYGIHELGADVLTLMDHLDIEQADWCGISMGGMTGMWLALNAPGRFGKLVLANTAARMPPPELWDQRSAQARAEGMRVIADATMTRWFPCSFAKENPHIVAHLHGVIASTSAEGYAGCCAAIRDFDLSAAIAGIRHPVLVIVGETDRSTPPEAGALIADEIAGATLIRLDAGHMSSVERPDGFGRAVAEFLR